MPEISNNPNYDTLIDTVKKQDAKISELEKKLNEVCEFNKSLLSSDSKVIKPDAEEEKSKNELDDFLEGK